MSRKYRKSHYRKSRNMYRSGLEKTFATVVPKGEFEYEPFDVPYVVYRKYKPDFVHTSGIMIECKGYFRAGDTLKYKSIRDTVDAELVFVLSDPNKKVRKGSKMTMAQWCEKEKFKYFSVSEVEELMNYVHSR